MTRRWILKTKLLLPILFLAMLVGEINAGQKTWKFCFGTDEEASGWTRVDITNRYDSARGYGFEHLSTLGAARRFVSSDAPFQFSVKLPEGNYQVTAVLGSDAANSVTTIKAEARRLLMEKVRTPKAETVTCRFTVNVRTPEITAGERVRLKSRELESEMISWDERLTLEFLGLNPALRSLEIKPVNVPTIFIAGDSTVCDQPREPWNSWGQMVPRFLGAGVAVANYAQSGESIKSSLAAKRFDKVFSQMKSNDWIFVQFGHNDMKDKATNALAIYKANLKKIVAQTRAKGATPVLVTSMERKNGVERATLAGYPQTVRDVAREEQVALIDLQVMSQVLYQALGDKLDRAFQDGSHHNNFGSYELARCVVEGIRGIPGLAGYLAGDAAPFDPRRPDNPDEFLIPASPAEDLLKPDGN